MAFKPRKDMVFTDGSGEHYRITKLVKGDYQNEPHFCYVPVHPKKSRITEGRIFPAGYEDCKEL